jgi:hypothetical protein
MKKLLILLVLLACAGCNNFQSKSDMEACIKTQGLGAIDALVAGSPSEFDKIKADMQEDNAQLMAYLDGATTNVWAYWFSGKKIYCSQAMYESLENFYAMSNEYLYGRLDDGTAENNAKQWRRNKAALINVRDWCLGQTHSTGEKK